MKIALKKSNILAIIFWLTSLVAAFKIPPSSSYIWLPDALLLFGFWPLLIASRARWFWLIFGICNVIAGSTLALAICVPDNFFATYHLTQMNKHLQLYHPFMVWLLIGSLSTVIGAILLITSWVLWLIKFSRQSRQN